MECWATDKGHRTILGVMEMLSISSFWWCLYNHSHVSKYTEQYTKSDFYYKLHLIKKNKKMVSLLKQCEAKNKKPLAT